MLYEKLPGLILESFYKVYNTLGFGFLEKVYENALMIELTKRVLNVASNSALMFSMKKNVWGIIMLI